MLDAKEIKEELGGLPIVIRPSFTMGGAGGGIVWTEEEFDKSVSWTRNESSAFRFIEESIFGWKEYELEL